MQLRGTQATGAGLTACASSSTTSCIRVNLSMRVHRGPHILPPVEQVQLGVECMGALVGPAAHGHGLRLHGLWQPPKGGGVRDARAYAPVVHHALQLPAPISCVSLRQQDLVASCRAISCSRKCTGPWQPPQGGGVQDARAYAPMLHGALLLPLPCRLIFDRE